MSKIYLAGPIKGLQYETAVGWREEVAQFMPNQIRCFSPLRAKGHLAGMLLGGSIEDNPLTSRKGIVSRDFWDVMTCDLLFVNLLGATTVSIGTIFEIAWGFALRKPIVIVMEESGNPHDHDFIRETASYVVSSLDEGIRVTRAVLLSE